MGPLIDSPCTSVSCPTCLLILNLPLWKFTSLQGSATFTKTSLTAQHSTALNTLQPILLPFLHTCMHKKCMAGAGVLQNQANEGLGMLTHKDHLELFISQPQLIITQVYVKCFPQR